MPACSLHPPSAGTSTHDGDTKTAVILVPASRNPLGIQIVFEPCVWEERDQQHRAVSPEVILTIRASRRRVSRLIHGHGRIDSPNTVMMVKVTLMDQSKGPETEGRQNTSLIFWAKTPRSEGQLRSKRQSSGSLLVRYNDHLM